MNDRSRRTGKSALYTNAAETAEAAEAEAETKAETTADPAARTKRVAPGARPSADRVSGRDALFGHDATSGRPVTITCSSCGAQTPTSVVDTVKGVLRPGSISIPFAKHGTRMRCPACGDSTWCRLSRHRSRR